MSKIQKFAKNPRGVDYICADIHGHFSLLENYLREVNFNYTTDRLFSLGDLIDRGDESPKVLEYLAQPWFYAILGNHEVMLLNAFDRNDLNVYRWWYHWGGEWAQELSKAQLQPYYEVFRQLPVAIELTLKDDRKVALVHAELPGDASWNRVCENLSTIPDDAANLDSYGIAGLIWAKSQVYATEEDKKKIKPVKHVDHVFHGHCIVYYQPETIANRTFMDLGSYETGEIGFIEPRTFLQDLKTTVIQNKSGK
jgi:serine/threonine protein phosphatase 1